LNRGVTGETANFDIFAQFFPAIIGDQKVHDLFQSYTVQWVFGLLFVHVSGCNRKLITHQIIKRHLLQKMSSRPRFWFMNIRLWRPFIRLKKPKQHYTGIVGKVMGISDR
jgi:hypothetical protein